MSQLNPCISITSNLTLTEAENRVNRDEESSYKRSPTLIAKRSVQATVHDNFRATVQGRVLGKFRD